MARLLWTTLVRAGFDPELASEVRTLEKHGDRDAQDRAKRESETTAADLIGHYSSVESRRRPRLWFTYHVYYKAPDWIGPAVADALRIPYVIAEGSRAGKRARGPWALGHRGAEPALERDRPTRQRLIDLPPFLDEEWMEPVSSTPRAAPVSEAPSLLTVAMMRTGDKLASYRLLAESLAEIADLPWTLGVVGDGEARDEIGRLFESFAGRIRFHGEIGDRAALRALYDAADLFVWPAVHEAYGMALLEAQARGCPVVAGAFGGVASVVRDGETGCLTPPGDPRAFAQAVRSLLLDADARQRLGLAARRFVAEDRTLGIAAERVRDVLMPLVGRVRP
jgi:glycosyltransferase involved in cell wall biosynthesis